MPYQGFRVFVEPHLKTTVGLRKPHLICVKDGKAYFTDAQIVSGATYLKGERSAALNRECVGLADMSFQCTLS